MVAMLSLWRNDAKRNLGRRAVHLLEKAESFPGLRFIWVVGDSIDATEEHLRALAGMFANITVIRHDTLLQADDPATRLIRLGQTANAGLEAVQSTDSYVIIHESDLQSPADLVQRFLAHEREGRRVIAGWPVLRLHSQMLFYDTWAYKKNGVNFTNLPPYHECYQHDRPFKVDSVGSCWMFPAEDVVGPDGVRCKTLAVRDLCAGLRAKGRSIWVDPTLTIRQPTELWKPLPHYTPPPGAENE